MKCLQFLLANYNSAEHIGILIKSLRTYHPGFMYEILVCDNGSTDGSDRYLERLEEVTLWRLTERPPDDDYNRRQHDVIAKYDLEPLMTDYFRDKTVKRDYRQSHNSALNFLMRKVTSPIFATLDSDIEFLGPNWIEPFLLPFLLDPNVGCVGLEEDIVRFNIGPFHGYTSKRIHPCLALWRTKYVWDTQANWDVDDEFDLRLLIMKKSLLEDQPVAIRLGDTGFKITEQLEANEQKVVSMPIEDFFRSCRHFYGTTVEKVYFNDEWDNWLNEIKQDHRLKPLADFTELSQQYSKFSQSSLNTCQQYWKDKYPALAKQPEVPLVFVD